MDYSINILYINIWKREANVLTIVEIYEIARLQKMEGHIGSLDRMKFCYEDIIRIFRVWQKN